ncbi:MAG: Zn-dependent hydrolase [Gammaproteobacteria bacterium]|nr:Zn-dependent hydrolase [Gammaproteobacteria bacterium]
MENNEKMKKTDIADNAEHIRIDADRLWRSLMEMARIGATDKGGVCRLAMTDIDREGRDLLTRWCREIGCSHTLDRAGNLFIRRAGADDGLPAVMTGSHLDSQPTGGRFDGVYGVLAGLEVLRTLVEHGVTTRAPLELAVWNNEEGSRFSPPMMGSGAYAGVFALDWVYALEDADGVTVREELERLGWIGEGLGDRAVDAYFEAHIEQGPILENERTTIGVVTGAQGQRWYELDVYGQEAHAGPTPMPLRKDALVCTAGMIQAVNRMGLDNAPDACATCGLIRVVPGSRNVIPGHVWTSIDTRHPDDRVLEDMEGAMRREFDAIADRYGCRYDLSVFWVSPATPFDRECVDLVRKGAAQGGYSHRDMISGAGHDAVYMARKVPTAMIFVPCEGGISHNESENADPEDLAAGCQVLLDSMLARAGVA